MRRFSIFIICVGLATILGSAVLIYVGETQRPYETRKPTLEIIP